MIWLFIFFIPLPLILVLALWNAVAWPIFNDAAPVRPGLVSVLIPARNEEANLAACLESVMRQDATVGEALVYDDHSTDATPRILDDYALREARVRAVTPLPLPAGWLGKNFACARLAEKASGEWLLFLDADARLSDGAVARMLEEARLREVTLLSGWPSLTMESFWERVLMPMLNFVVFSLFPASLSLRRDDASLGLAHGACILVERAGYNAVGGHAAAPHEIFEDQSLARLWRKKGERGLCLDGRGIVSVRMYSSLAGIWRGFQKNFFPAFRRESSFWGFILLHVTMFLAPFAALPWIRMWPIFTAVACALAVRGLLVLRFGHPWLSVLLHPVAEVVLIAIGLSSWLRCKSGRGVDWKGRRYNLL
ncbi:MAG: glycosyltransferase [Chloracidobacterium sp.]|nr:glycosyltransferase [Chloracidobacterium sp.]